MRKWTKQEDDLVLQYASDFSDNMRKGFLVLSFKIGRSPETIVTRFYNKLNKIDNKELYKNTTLTNMQIDSFEPLKYDRNTLLRKSILIALKRAEIKIKAYNMSYNMANHELDVLLNELYNELL